MTQPKSTRPRHDKIVPKDFRFADLPSEISKFPNALVHKQLVIIHAVNSPHRLPSCAPRTCSLLHSAAMIGTRLTNTSLILPLLLCFRIQTGELTEVEATTASAAFISPQRLTAPLSSVCKFPHQQRQHAHWRPPPRQPRPSRQQSPQVTMGGVLRPGTASAGVLSLIHI